MRKKCSRCKIEKDFEEFHKRPMHKDGRDFICKTCAVEKDRANKKKKKDEREQWPPCF
jgi:hypothetical protein